MTSHRPTTAPLNARYCASIVLAVLTSIFDFLDFFIVGFLVAVLASERHLTFGQTSLMLLSAGIGAILGSLLWRQMASLRSAQSPRASAVLRRPRVF